MVHEDTATCVQGLRTCSALTREHRPSSPPKHVWADTWSPGSRPLTYFPTFWRWRPQSWSLLLNISEEHWVCLRPTRLRPLHFSSSAPRPRGRRRSANIAASVPDQTETRAGRLPGIVPLLPESLLDSGREAADGSNVQRLKTDDRCLSLILEDQFIPP